MCVILKKNKKFQNLYQITLNLLIICQMKKWKMLLDNLKKQL